MAHPAFTHQRSQEIPSLNVTLEEYTHNKTGAWHIHLKSDNPENVFLVALRTVPHDSTGVAHILEHTALCGSEKFPVRDPFFMMTRRSLNTFMNALTSSDWTAYPFASVNRKDFDNLMDVYLDAVFFSRLDPLDFAQEGHRLEFSEADNPNSKLEFKGVVFNEMKGAMSSISSQLWHTFNKYLHPSTTYHHNSGGEPDCIPDLSYEQLLGFYKTHYHPSNAIFMTYGDISAEEHQAKFESQALCRFEALEEEIRVPDEKRYAAPVKVEEFYPVSKEDSEGNKTHVVMGWLLGRTTDLEEALSAQLVSSVLLDNSACPLMHTLETTDLGNAPSPLCGLDDSQKEMAFICGLEGCAKNSSDDVEALIINKLKEIAEQGIPQEDIEAALHQLELHQREIGGDSYPYGLQLIMNGLTAATHRGDPAAMLDIDNALNTLREAIKNPDFIKNKIQSLFLDNPHFVRLTLSPDTELNNRKEAAERRILDNIQQQLSEEQKQQIVKQAAALKARQEANDDATILPKVTLEDVPKEESHVAPIESTMPNTQRPLSTYNVGSNGLVYQQIVVDLPALDDELLPYLPYYTSCVTELGVGDKDYLAVQRWQASVSGAFNAFSSIRSSVDDIHKTNNFLTFSGKALNRNHQALCDLMSQTLDDVTFAEHSRIKELISQIRASREQSVTHNGHGLALSAASAGMCGASRLSHELSGLAGLRALKRIDDSLKTPEGLAAFCKALAQIHQAVQNAPRRFLLIGEEESQSELTANFHGVWDKPLQNPSFSPLEVPSEQKQVHEAWLTNSQVNFCAMAFPTVPMTHPDAAPLVVLGNVLRNGFLHRAIREQGGAYGGGASQDNNSASFRFYSYRDPRIEDTFKDFKKSVHWLIDNDISWQSIEEAILGVVSGIDKPDSPAGRAKRLFHADLHGRTLEKRQAFREQLLATRAEDLKRVAETYLCGDNASQAVVCDHSKAELVNALELEKQIL